MHKTATFTLVIGGMLIATSGPLAAQRPADQPDPNSYQPESVTSVRAMPQNLQRLSKLIGKNIESSTGEKLGEIKDLAIDSETGVVAYAVVSYGGIAGVGDKLVSAPISAFDFRHETRQANDPGKLDNVEKATLSIDQGKFKTAPTFAKDQWPNRVNYDFWNLPADPNRNIIGPIVKGSDIVGMDLHNEQDEDLGEVQDLVVNLLDGKIAYAVLATGGVLGVGEKYHAVPMQVLSFRSEKGEGKQSAYINVDKDRLKAAPTFAKNAWPNMADNTWSSSIHSYYGTKPTDVYGYRSPKRDATRYMGNSVQGDAESIISAWPAASRQAAEDMIQKYGSPHSITRNTVAWENVGPWRAVIVTSEATPHNFPTAHQDVIMQCVSMKVPAEKVSEISKFDGSISVDRTRGIVAARCDKEANNILALNLAYDIVTGKKTAEQARDFLARAVNDSTSTDSTGYMAKLNFASDNANTGDADQAASGARATDGQDR